MSKNVNALEILEHFAQEGVTSRDRINAGRALSAVKELIEATSVLRARLCLHGDWEDGCYYYNGYSAPELQAPMAQVDSALIRINGEQK